MAAGAGVDPPQYDQWLAELDAANGGDPVGAPPTAGHAASTGPGEGMESIQQLENELKLLHWHKLANESALKAAILRTKRVRGRDKDRSSTQTAQAGERAAWLRQIVADEQAKPLDVNDDFLESFRHREEEKQRRLEQEVSHHIDTLHKLKGRLLKQDREDRRRRELAAASRALGPEPQSLEEFERRGPTAIFGLTETGGAAAASEGPESKVPASSPARATGAMVSLGRLVELESRIAALESTDALSVRSGAPGTPGSVAGSRRSGRQRASGRGTMAAPRARAGTAAAREAAAAESKRRMDRARRQQRRVRQPAPGKRQDEVITDWLEARATKKTQRRQQVRKRAAAATRGPAASAARGRDTSAAERRDRATRARVRARAPAGSGVDRSTQRTGVRKRTASRHAQPFNELRKQFEQAHRQPARGRSRPAASGSSRAGSTTSIRSASQPARASGRAPVRRSGPPSAGSTGRRAPARHSQRGAGGLAGSSSAPRRSVPTSRRAAPSSSGSGRRAPSSGRSSNPGSARSLPRMAVTGSGSSAVRSMRRTAPAGPRQEPAPRARATGSRAERSGAARTGTTWTRGVPRRGGSARKARQPVAAARPAATRQPARGRQPLGSRTRNAWS